MKKRRKEVDNIKFVFKNVVIVDCISISHGRSHMTAVKSRVISETRVF